MIHEGINWNRIEDPKDKEIWDRVTANYWIDTKIAISNDISSWNSMSHTDQKLVTKVFGGDELVHRDDLVILQKMGEPAKTTLLAGGRTGP